MVDSTSLLLEACGEDMVQAGSLMAVASTLLRCTFEISGHVSLVTFHSPNQ